jgi:hypothetical protein
MALVVGVGAAAVGGGLEDAVAQSKEGIIILDKQGINPADPDKPALRKGKALRVNPEDPDIDPSDPDKPAIRLPDAS